MPFIDFVYPVNNPRAGIRSARSNAYESGAAGMGRLSIPPPAVIEAEFERFVNDSETDNPEEIIEFARILDDDWSEYDFRDDFGDGPSSDPDDYVAAAMAGDSDNDKVLRLDAIGSFFRDTKDFGLLTQDQERLYGRAIKTYGPAFRGGVLQPGWGTVSIARQLIRYIEGDGFSAKCEKYPGFNTSKRKVRSMGPDAVDEARRIVKGENVIVQRLFRESLSPRSRKRLADDMGGLQNESRETLLPFEPTLGNIDDIFASLAVYASNIKRLSGMLKGNGGDEAAIRKLMNISREAGDLPDRFPDFMEGLAQQRGVYLGARDNLAKGNVRLVGSIAKKYRGRGIPFEDLIGHGTVGLMKGVDRFDESMGYKFSTYCWWWIRQAITRAIHDKARSIRMPAHAIENGRMISGARKDFFLENCRYPDKKELAERLGVSTEFIDKYSFSIVTSYDRPVMYGSDDFRVTFIEDNHAETPTEIAKKRACAEVIEDVLSDFSLREANIIRMRYGLREYDGRTHTLEEVGRIYGVTRERIRQLEAKTERRCRHPIRARRLAPFLEIELDERGRPVGRRAARTYEKATPARKPEYKNKGKVRLIS